MKITTNNSFLFLIDVRHYIIYIMISEAAPILRRRAENGG
jgi:hypothetical protein